MKSQINVYELMCHKCGKHMKYLDFRAQSKLNAL